MPWEHTEIPQEEQKDVAGEKDIWAAQDDLVAMVTPTQVCA